MRLIKNIEEVLNIIPVSMTSNIDVVKSYLSMAERNIIQLIGRAQFDKLVAAYNYVPGDPDAPSVIMKEAVEIAQRIVVNLGYLYAIPVLSVKISSAGMMVNSNADTKQAFSWQVGKVENSLRDLGFGSIEDLLELLESNPDDFPEYNTSDEFKKQKQYFISSAAEFTQFFNIGGSRYVFQCLSYIMKRIEEQYVSRLFGSAYIQSLRDPDVTISVGSRKLLDNYIKPGVALLTAAKALRERVITFENGVATINLHGNYDAAKKEMVADRATVDAAYDQLTEDGNRYLSDGLLLIADNPIDFPDFTIPISKRKFKVVNDREKGIWAN